MLTLKSRSGCGRVNYSQYLGFDQNTVRGLENVNGLLTGKQDSPKKLIWYGCGIGKENNIPHSNDRSLGCRILMMEEEQECGIRTPFPEPSGCHLA